MYMTVCVVFLFLSDTNTQHEHVSGVSTIGYLFSSRAIMCLLGTLSYHNHFWIMCGNADVMLRPNMMKLQVASSVLKQTFQPERGFHRLYRIRESHVASDSMYFSKQGHGLLFLFVSFSKEFQCGQLGHIQALQVRHVSNGAFRLVFLSLFWLRLHRRFGYGLGVFQGLEKKERNIHIC